MAVDSITAAVVAADSCHDNGYSGVHVVFDSSLGVNNLKIWEFENLKIWPNPATNTITIEGAMGCDVEIFNVVGMSEHDFKRLRDGQDSRFVKIDVSGLVAGVYMVEVVDRMTGERVVRKVVKE
jgi:hypothetical protein